MSTLNIVLSILTVLSFGLALASFVRTEIKKANEKAKNEITREKLANLQRALTGLFYATDGVVQASKESDARPSELGNMTRIVRGQIGVLLGGIRKYRIHLDNWRFGVMVPSDNLEVENALTPPEEEKSPEASPNKNDAD